MATQQHQGKCGVVVAAVQREISGQMLQQLGRARHVAGGVLESDDSRHLRQPQRGFGTQIGHGTSRHVVQNDRQVDCFGDLAKVLVQAFLRRLVVVRHNLQRRVRTHLLRMPRQFDCLGRRVATRAGDHRNAPARRFHCDLDQLAVLARCHRRRFAGGAHRNDRTRTLRNMPIDQAAIGVEVERTVFVHRRYDGNETPSDHGVAASLFGLKVAPDSTGEKRA